MLESIPRTAKMPPQGTQGGVLEELRAGYFVLPYVRSASVFFADSIFSPPLLPRMLMCA
jgi:hypothetical protein